MKTLYLLILFFFLSNLYSQERYSVRLSSADLTNGSDLSLEDGRFDDFGSGTFTDIDNYAVLTLGISRREIDFFASSYSTTVTFTYDAWDNQGNQFITGQAGSLTVSYDPITSSISQYEDLLKIQGAAKVHVYLSSQSAVSNLYLEGEVYAERYHMFDPTVFSSSLGANLVSFTGMNETVAFNQTITTPTTDEIEIWWSHIEGASLYELEFTWIDNYDASGGSLDLSSSLTQLNFDSRDFELNSTRISTSDPYFRIPNIYAKGFLIYRVRGVGKWITDLDKSKFGAWSSTSTDLTSWDNVEIQNVHDGNKNWQYQATYAEGGKMKAVSTYFDGSLRTRQTVTKINSNNEAVAGESVYDAQGRAAIQILPSPLNSGGLRYYPNLNVNSVGEPYSHEDFDWDPIGVSCGPQAGIMSNVSGANQYYSANNIQENNWNDHVPNAEGFAFTQVEYTPDNTGRIRAQGGLGSGFQIGEGKETQYFYLQPSQEELNRLFGNNVGYKSRYKKNMVVDPNGQVSISYLDPSGKVIATALGGNNDNSIGLKSLGDELGLGDVSHIEVTSDLLNKDNANDVNDPEDDNELFSTGAYGAWDDALRMGTQIGVPIASSIYTIDYTLDGDVFTATCPGGVTKNYPYVYDLSISMNDDCGNDVLSSGAVDATIGSVDLSSPTVGFGTGGDYLGLTTNALPIGSYTLNKTLTVNQTALDEYVVDYMTNISSCLLEVGDFTDALSIDCITDCDECKASLGTLADYKIRVALEVSELPDDVANWTSEQVTEVEMEHARLFAECDQMCPSIVTDCQVTRGLMKADLSPGGQYGSTTPGDLTSIYNELNELSSFLVQNGTVTAGEVNWKHPVDENYNASHYYNSNGDIAYIQVQYDPVSDSYDPQVSNPVQGVNVIYVGPGNIYKVEPQELEDVADFITHFNFSWAESLLPYHPEFCYLSYYDELCANVQTSSDLSAAEYTTYLMQMNYEQATQTNGGTNPWGINLTSTSNIVQSDPFRTQTYANITDQTLKNTMLDEIWSQYKVVLGAPMNMWDVALYIQFGANDWTGTFDVSTVDLTALSIPQKDALWQTYVSLYTSKREMVEYLFATKHGLDNGCWNQCIGEDPPALYSWVIMSYAAIVSGNTSSFLQLMTQGTHPYFNSNHLCFAPDGHLYTGKEQRIIAPDLLYNSDVSPEDAIDEMANEADYNVYLQTGQCPLAFDLQAFLSGHGQSGGLTTGTQEMANVVSFGVDLYQAMGGLGVVGGPFPNSVNILSNNSGSVLNIQLQEDNVIRPEVLQLTLPVGENWLGYDNGAWQFISMHQMHYVPGSYNGSTYSFQIIMQVNVAGVIEEWIVEGVTSIAIGECTVDNNAPTNPHDNMSSQSPLTGGCDKESLLEDALNNILSEAFLTGGMTNTTPVSLSTTNAQYWYDGSILYDYLDQGLVSNTNFTGGTTTWSISTGNSQIVLTSLTALPATAVSLSGINIDPDNMTFTISYLNDNGSTITQETLTGNISYVLNGLVQTSFDVSCPCDEELVEELIAQIIEEILVEYTANGNSISSPFTPPSLIDLAPFISGGSTQLHGVTVNEAGVTFNFQKSSCPQAFLAPFIDEFGDVIAYDDISIDLDPNSTIGNIVVTISGVDQSYSLRYDCLDIEPCNACIPQQLAPVSCTDAYAIFVSNMSTVMGVNYTIPVSWGVSEEEREAWFCARNYAYSITNYNDFITQLDASYTALGEVLTQESPLYLTISEFIMSDLNQGYSDMNLVIADYFTYLSGGPSDSLRFAIWVNEVYLIQNTSICPPLPLQGSFPGLTIQTVPCDYMENNINNVSANFAYQQYLVNVEQAFREEYIENAIGSAIEGMHMTYPDKEYHYTLYYYDQSGNLIQTVPPEGIKRTGTQDGVYNSDRSSSSYTATNGINPIHTKETQYVYNSLNQLVWQHTPDGGESRFAYDHLGRLIISQNAKQRISNNFSYTVYDGLGRVDQVGEINSSADYTINDKGRLVHLGTELDLIINPDYLNQMGSVRKEVVKTIYDEYLLVAGNNIASYFSSDAPSNMRNRISTVVYTEGVFDPLDNSLSNFTNLTSYEYDVHGNVKHLLQMVNDADLIDLNQAVKQMKYSYDLVSGNVKEVVYQPGEADEYIHRYEYDADNRITNVYSGRDQLIEQQQAKYFYYDHGPLARVELGDEKVQSLDYAYTLQGWIKSVNGDHVDSPQEAMGRDGDFEGLNRLNGRDVFGYALNYYDGDYQSRIAPANSFLAYNNTLGATPNNDLFNGNIKSMSVALSDVNEVPIDVLHNEYTYDQLNRILKMSSHQLTSSGLSSTEQYKSTYGYDRDGNLNELNRWAFDSGLLTQFDQFSYEYGNLSTDGNANNQLKAVADQLGHSMTGIEDVIPGQTFDLSTSNNATDNYNYDAIGQLIKDDQEDIENIEWTVTGKVKRVNYTAASSKNDIEFVYDAMGNRLAKKEHISIDETKTNWYFRDAQGNPMVTYEHKKEPIPGSGSQYLSKLTVLEKNIYGSSRVGVENINEIIATNEPVSSPVNINTGLNIQKGAITYELTNHLGNVLSTVTDKKLINVSACASGYLSFDGNDFVKCSVDNRGIQKDLTIEARFRTSVNDGQNRMIVSKRWDTSIPYKGYYLCIQNGFPKFYLRDGGANPYILQGPNVVSDGQWHHIAGTVNAAGEMKLYIDGVEVNQMVFVPSAPNVNIESTRMLEIGHLVTYSTLYWIGDIDEVRLWNVEKSQQEIQNAMNVSIENPMTGLVACFPLNCENGLVHDDVSAVNIDGWSTNLDPLDNPTYQLGGIDTEIKFLADVQSYSDYYPFGMQMPNRNGSSGDYRYGFNGMESDDEVKGTKNSYTTTFRQYDPRVARWLSIDPKQSAWESPYVSMANNPMIFTDVNGDTVRFVNEQGDLVLQINSDKENVVYHAGSEKRFGTFVDKITSYIVKNVYSDNLMYFIIQKAGFDEAGADNYYGDAYNSTDRVFYDMGYQNGLDGESSSGSDLFRVSPDTQKDAGLVNTGYRAGLKDRKDYMAMESARENNAEVTVEKDFISINKGWFSYEINEKIDGEWQKRKSYINEKSRKSPEGTIPQK